jgi:hypothetical protein
MRRDYKRIERVPKALELGRKPRRKAMMTDMKKSYKALAIVGVMALLPLEYLQGAENGSHKKPVFTDPIVGAWNCQIPPAGGAPGFNDIKKINVGGTQSEIDNAAPPSQESPTVGTWVSTGPLTYSQKAYQMSWDPNGNFIGTWHYTGPMSLSPALNELNIHGKATLFDANGNVITSFPFTASCTRL